MPSTSLALPLALLLLSAPMAHAAASPRRAAHGAEARVVLEIERQGRAEVAALVGRMPRTGGSDRRERDRLISNTKLQCDLDVLRARAAYARDRFDLASVDELERSIAMLLHPVFRAPLSRSMKGDPVHSARVAVDAPAHVIDESMRPLFSTEPRGADPLSIAAGNLDNTVTLPGWTRPIVARSDETASANNVVPSAALDGDAPNTFVSFAWRQTGTLTAYSTGVHIDDVRAASAAVANPSPPQDYQTLNAGPFTVRGGRHTIRSIVDSANAVAETNEGDNTFTTQYLWTPRFLWGPMTREVPPNPGNFAFPYVNADGFMYQRSSSNFAWVVSEAATNPGDDYDLVLFDDYGGATSGYSNAIASSRSGGNTTDFVVGHYSGTPTAVYPAVSFYAGAGGGGPFVVSGGDASGRNGSDDSNSFAGQTMSPGRMADVYEASLWSSSQWYLTLRRRSGTSDLSFEIFPGTPGGVYHRGEGTASSALNGSPIVDVLGPFTPSVSDWHPIVVYRDNGTHANEPVTYEFYWSSAGFLDAPDSPAGGTLQFLGATPNPLADGGRFGFVLSAAGRARLELFDLSGRRVRTLADGDFAAGRQAVEWDGRDALGSRVGAGVYWARFEAMGRTFSKAVVLTR